MYTADMIKDKLSTDDRWLVRGLLAIYNRQTASEQSYQETRDKNGVGFNGPDAQILSSIAQFYLSRRYITEKQLRVVRKKMLKYAGQLAKIANNAI